MTDKEEAAPQNEQEAADYAKEAATYATYATALATEADGVAERVVTTQRARAAADARAAAKRTRQAATNAEVAAKNAREATSLDAAKGAMEDAKKHQNDALEAAREARTAADTIVMDHRKALGKPPYQVISMDGGGIYGRVTARLLRRLCDRDENFLQPSFIDHPDDKDEAEPRKILDRKYIFAGTSAGAINALLLAKQENPRKFVESGGLEDFWANPGIYSNRTNPVHAMTSMMGLTGWLGFHDFKDLLSATFGELTLDQLHHNVLVTVFNFAGTIHPRTHVRQWTPKSFVNFGHRAAPNMLVADLAYAAASPPSLRAIQGGLGDGGIFAPNPSDNVLTELINVMTQRPEAQDGGQNVFRTMIETRTPDLDNPDQDPAQITLLSLGIGYCPAHYSLFDFDFGPLPFSLFPTNLQDARYLPAALTMGLDASSRIAEERTWLLLGRNCHRLDPPLLQPPIFPPALVATALCRFDPWREFFLAEIDKVLATERANNHIDDAVDFIASTRWQAPAATPEDLPYTIGVTDLAKFYYG